MDLGVCRTRGRAKPAGSQRLNQKIDRRRRTHFPEMGRTKSFRRIVTKMS